MRYKDQFMIFFTLSSITMARHDRWRGRMAKNTYTDKEMSNDDIVADIRVQVTFDFFSRTQ